MKYKVKAFFSFLLPALVGVIFLCSCNQSGGDRGSSSPSGGSVVRIKADLSLKPVVDELSGAYQQDASVQVQLRYASSFEIRPDEAGDSVDVYLLANNPYGETLTGATDPDSSRKKVLAYAIPCIIVPQLNPALVSDLKELSKPNLRVALADPRKDVLGAFAVEILKKNGVYDAIQPRLIPVGPSALNMVEYVARKEADAGIGWTHSPMWVQGSADVVLLNASEIPRIAAITAQCAAAPVDSIRAVRLMNFLGSDRGLEFFRKWGYAISTEDLEMYAPIAEIGGTPQP